MGSGTRASASRTSSPLGAYSSAGSRRIGGAYERGRRTVDSDEAAHHGPASTWRRRATSSINDTSRRARRCSPLPQSEVKPGRHATAGQAAGVLQKRIPACVPGAGIAHGLRMRSRIALSRDRGSLRTSGRYRRRRHKRRRQRCFGATYRARGPAQRRAARAQRACPFPLAGDRRPRSGARRFAAVTLRRYRAVEREPCRAGASVGRFGVGARRARIRAC